MKHQLIAFAVAFTSLCFTLSAIWMGMEAREIPPPMYSGGKAFPLHTVITIVGALGVCTALVGAGLLAALARKRDRTTASTRLHLASWACLIPTLIYVASAATHATN